MGLNAGVLRPRGQNPTPRTGNVATNIPGIGPVSYPSFDQMSLQSYNNSGNADFLRQIHNFGSRLDPKDWEIINSRAGGLLSPPPAQQIPSQQIQPVSTQGPASPTFGRYGLLAQQMAGAQPKAPGGMPPSRIPYQGLLNGQ